MTERSLLSRCSKARISCSNRTELISVLRKTDTISSSVIALSKCIVSKFLHLLNPLCPPSRWLKGVGPEFNLMNNLFIADCGERDDSTNDNSVSYSHI